MSYDEHEVLMRSLLTDDGQESYWARMSGWPFLNPIYGILLAIYHSSELRSVRAGAQRRWNPSVMSLVDYLK